MRWGVREEAEDDHMTTELCLKEIKACQTLSIGPKFVVSCRILWGLILITCFLPIDSDKNWENNHF